MTGQTVDSPALELVARLEWHLIKRERDFKRVRSIELIRITENQTNFGVEIQTWRRRR